MNRGELWRGEVLALYPGDSYTGRRTVRVLHGKGDQCRIVAPDTGDPVSVLPRDTFQRTLFACFLLFFAGSCLAPPFLQFLMMQHVPTVLGVLLLGYASNRFVISRLSFLLIILFLCLHTLGARYLYSYTPYDVWSEQLLGVNITESFGFRRNHFDRLVHFSYGLLLAVPVQEIERRYLRLSRIPASVLAVEFILATSAAYELIEWFIAVMFTPDWAESFLGQQGDKFDAQKDTALATMGAVLSVSISVMAEWLNADSSPDQKPAHGKFAGR